jgi:hypothetical protein
LPRKRRRLRAGLETLKLTIAASTLLDRDAAIAVIRAGSDGTVGCAAAPDATLGAGSAGAVRGAGEGAAASGVGLGRSAVDSGEGVRAGADAGTGDCGAAEDAATAAATAFVVTFRYGTRSGYCVPRASSITIA